MLSTKQFSKIVKLLGRDAVDADFPGNEKRRAPRMAMQNRATIVPHIEDEEGDGHGVGVEVRDFSARGIRFLHSKRLEPGSQFVLELAQQMDDPVRILCTVMHCRLTAEGPVSIGAEFTCVLRKNAAAVSAGERERIRHSILDSK